MNKLYNNKYFSFRFFFYKMNNLKLFGEVLNNEELETWAQVHESRFDTWLKDHREWTKSFNNFLFDVHVDFYRWFLTEKMKIVDIDVYKQILIEWLQVNRNIENDKLQFLVDIFLDNYNNWMSDLVYSIKPSISNIKKLESFEEEIEFLYEYNQLCGQHFLEYYKSTLTEEKIIFSQLVTSSYDKAMNEATKYIHDKFRKNEYFNISREKTIEELYADFEYLKEDKSFINKHIQEYKQCGNDWNKRIDISIFSISLSHHYRKEGKSWLSLKDNTKWDKFSIDEYLSKIFMAYEILDKLYRGEKEINNLDKNPEPFKREFTQAQQKKLLKGLIKREFIDELTIPDHFNYIFGKSELSDSEPFMPLQWIGLLQDLKLFINTILPNESKKWQITANCFQINGEPIKPDSLKNAESSADSGKKKEYFKSLIS